MRPVTSALRDHGRVVLTANVRAGLFPGDATVGDGVGRDGDLVFGTVFPRAGTRLEILDHESSLVSTDEPRQVVAVLGSRNSSTHVCAVVPASGIAVHEGLELDWIGGPSGIVGHVVRENEALPETDSERATQFRCTGLLHAADGRVLNVEDFAVRPDNRCFDLPLVLVAATSAEAGKTVLSGKLIAHLAGRGLRVGAIKATGTGGGLDSRHHRDSGAAVTLDQVDAGLVTTHGAADVFKRRIVRVFRRMQDLDVDVVLAELGGDLVSANNPAFFEIDELAGRARIMFVIANDALAAHGAARFTAERLDFPAGRIRYVTSPFRNHEGMRNRFAALGIDDPLDPNDADALGRVALETLRGRSLPQVQTGL